MSIYGTIASIGDLDFDGEDSEAKVVAYLGSHIYPYPDFEPGDVSLCAIPSWCVPGMPRDHHGGYEQPAPWLRLGIVNPYDSRWMKAVCIDEAAAIELRDALTRWIETPKTTPTANAARKDSA